MDTPLLHRLEHHASRIGCPVPLPPALASCLGIAEEAYVTDPRTSRDAIVVGSAVLRPARGAVDGAAVARDGYEALAAVPDWCHEVQGLPAGAVVSAGSRLDAARLAMHYGLSDAILVGSATVAAEGLPREGRSGWRWQASTPLAFAALATVRDRLASALGEARTHWRRAGFLSEREAPALVVVSRARGTRAPAWLEAPALREPALREPALREGEAFVLTSEAGAARIADWRHSDPDRVPEALGVLSCSPPGRPEEIDLAVVPWLLRARLDARIVGHDGGRSTLAAFAAAGALHQLNLTFVGGPPLAEAHPGRVAVPFFETADGRPGAAPHMTLIGADENAWLVQFDGRGGTLP